jgi:hemolysin activation/secretion protein
MLNSHWFKVAIVCCLWQLIAACCLAQTAPNAGTLMNNIDQGLRSQQSLSQSKKAFPPSMQLRLSDNSTFEFDSIVLRGNTILNQAALDLMVQPLTRTAITPLQIKSLARQVERLYKESGVDAWAYVPQQDLSSRQLIIQVIEHRVDPESESR